MKKKDIGLVGAIAFFAGVIALVVSNMLIATPENLQTEVEVVQPISAEFSEPDKRYFNPEAINPTRLIRIGESQNQNPFD